MYIREKLKPEFSVLLSIGIIGLLTFSPAFAQYDYYDPYSDSNIDYFPSNPIDLSPSPTNYGGTTGGTSGSTSGDTSNTTTPKEETKTSTYCTNRPTPNPQGTRSVEIRDEVGKVFLCQSPERRTYWIKSEPGDVGENF